MKKILNVLFCSFLALAIGSSVVSCNEDPIGIGDGLVGGDAESNYTSFDVIAFNTHYDSLRADQRVLQNAILGAFEEPVFGRTKAKLYSQFRLSNLNPSFGTNPIVDSVHLFIPVYFNSTTDSVRVDTLNLSKPGVRPTESDTILIKKTYRVDSIYGNRNATMRLNVREMNSMLYSDSSYYSNPSLRAQDRFNVNNTILGTKLLGSKVENITIKEYNGTTNIYDEGVGYKISLDKDFFTQKILANEKTGLLDDHASFIRRVLNGLEFSVEENNGFLIAFNPNLMTIKMYFSSQGTTEGSTRSTSSIEFNSLNVWNSAGGYNVQVNQIENTNRGSAFLNNINNPDRVNGSSRLFLNGADGTRVNVRIPQANIDELIRQKTAENWTIIGAKLQFYVDNSYNLKSPSFIMGWNNYKKDGSYVNELFSDVTAFYNAYPSNVHFNPSLNDNKFYTIDITKHIKNMVEKGETFEDQEMIVTLGNFLMSVSDNSSIFSSIPFYRNTIANPYRVVLHGNASEDSEKKLKLLVYYTKK